MRTKTLSACRGGEGFLAWLGKPLAGRQAMGSKASS